MFKARKEIVLQAAQNAIDTILAKRKALFEEKIDKAMKRWIFPPKTREDAKQAIISKARALGYYEDFSHYGEATARMAIELKAGCTLDEDNLIVIDREEADFVNSWR